MTPDDSDMSLGVWVCCDNDDRVISIHKTHTLADRHGWRLWQHIPGLPKITKHVQASLALQVRRGMKLGGTSPFVEITDRKPRGKSYAVYTPKKEAP